MMPVVKIGKAVFFSCFSLIMAGVCWSPQAKAALVSSDKPSIVKVEKGKLILQRRLPDGSLESPKPYLIKGTNWQPATRATSYFTGGAQAMKQWMRDEFVKYYQQDLPLMKEMNVNTVRVFIDFGVDPAVIKKILDECYRNGIMVIMTVATAKEDLESTGRFDIYSDFGAVNNHYVPSGWMGDRGTLSFNDKAGQPFSGTTCIKIAFNASSYNQWAGIFWQSPENNWGDLPGIDLRGYNKLVFMARSDTEGQVLDKVQFGGISNNNGQDTAKVEVKNVTLHKNWQQYSIDLSGYNLSNIRGGFCVVFSSNKVKNQTLYLDDIHLTGTPQKPWYQTIVELYKDHPAILMWSLGNEWNLSFNLYHGYSSVTEAAQVTQQAAIKIKQIDSYHPVSSCLGDRFDDPVPANTIFAILAQCPQIDIWGLNIYRGQSFGDLFNRWKNIAGAKPFYFSEFGTDSFRTIGFTAANNGVPAYGGFQAAKVIGSPDQAMQRDFDMRLWEEIKNHLAPVYADELCSGGLIYDWSDAIWKVGNYNVNLGGLVDYLTDNHSYQEYNPEGFVLAGHPDGVANEEYFGVVDSNRKPKLAYYELRDIYAKLKIGQPPIARIQVVRRIRNNPAVVSFRGDGSSDADGKIVSYYWDFGDRSFDRISRLRNPTHRFFNLSRSKLRDGYSVTLTVTDNDGLTSTASVVIPVPDSAR